MVRNYKRKTDNHGRTDASIMRAGVKMVLDGQSIRDTARLLNISKSTLQRYVSVSKQNGLSDDARMNPNYDHSRVFTDSQEKELGEYVILAAKHHHGLTVNCVRSLAYQYAAANKINMPESWSRHETAGIDWVYAFIERQGNISIRKPEATSLGRATSFNRSNVAKFFNNLTDIMERYHFEPGSIYNVDETALTTVHKPPKILAAKGEKQVGQITSAERGTLVTLCGAINALGNSVPPFLIYPRVHFKDHMILGAPPGSVGVSHSSGWMTGENFVLWMKHFISHSRCSVDHPVLLIMDNHDSHITVESLNLAKQNGIILLTLPPHCSHKLQPLDRTVYGPLKKFYNAACNVWQIENPGKPMTIYDIAGNLGKSFQRAFTPENIISGFKVSGISPLDPEIFTDDEFLSSYVTDRPEPTHGPMDQTHGTPSTSTSQDLQSQSDVVDQDDNISLTLTVDSIHEENQGRMNEQPVATSSQSSYDQETHLSPQDVRPFPKAGARKKSTCRQKRETSILTDTPIKAVLELEFEQRRMKRSGFKRAGLSKRVKLVDTFESADANVTNIDNDSSDNEAELETIMKEIDDDSDDSEDRSIFTKDSQLPIECDQPTKDNIKKDKYVLVKYATKKTFRYFIGVTVDDNVSDDNTMHVKFLVRHPSKTGFLSFTFPDSDDIDEIDIDDILFILPNPVSTGGTKRLSSRYVFNGVDLSRYF